MQEGKVGGLHGYIFNIIVVFFILYAQILSSFQPRFRELCCKAKGEDGNMVGKGGSVINVTEM